MCSQLKLPIVILLFLHFLAIQTVSRGRDFAQNQASFESARQAPPQSTAQVPAASPDKAEDPPRCETTGTKEITISCVYAPSIRASPGGKNVARIALNHAKLTFEPLHESYMLVELELTNEGKSSLTSAPAVYLAIDDDTGRNVVRRPLPHVDMARLHSGERLTFSERLLVGAFTGGRYTISLWIPDPEPSRKNIPAFNMLLCSAGVPDPTTGLNTVAHFSIAPSMHSSREE